MSDMNRRLLDMLAGWGVYVGQCAKAYPDEAAEYIREAERLVDLYQQAAHLPEDDADAVSAFVAAHVMPLLFTGQS